MSTTLDACAKHGFSWITNSGIWFAFNSDRMTSKKMREISAMSGAVRMKFIECSNLIDCWFVIDLMRNGHTYWSMWLVSWFSVVWYRLKHFWNVIPILLLVDQPTISGQTFAVDGSGFERQVAKYFHLVQFVQWHHFRLEHCPGSSVDQLCECKEITHAHQNTIVDF